MRSLSSRLLSWCGLCETHYENYQEQKSVAFRQLRFIIKREMNIYFQYIKKVFRLLSVLSKEKDIPRWYCFYDYFKSLLRHSCLIRQYVYGNFWKISEAQRKKVLTYRRISKLFDQLNQKSYIHFLENKNDFNSFFKDFVHRDWLYVTASSFEDFQKFTQKHHVVVVKPLRGVEGGG